jgi:hypothetical protein
MKTIKTRNLCVTIIICTTLLIVGCKRQDDWLNAKRLSSDVTPKSIDDFQAILNFDNIMNQKFATLGLLGCDNLYLTDTAFPSIVQNERDGYLWQKAIWDDNGGNSIEWINMFVMIEDANIVLDGLQNINTNAANYNDVKGQALFYRAIAYYTLAQLFCKQYDPLTASTDLGLPIRLSSDVNAISQRANLQKTYDQILSDATQASLLLNVIPVLQYRRPYKYSSYGLLAKIYLVMNDYVNAGLFAGKVLTNVSTLLDFNSNLVLPTSTYRFPVNGLNNPEILFYASSNNYTIIRPYTLNKAFVAPELYISYDNNDLRKTCFYLLSNGNAQFRGTYTGSNTNFAGIATNEMYLISAECYARQGNFTAALSDLNTLLQKRYKTGTYKNITASNADDALAIVLRERRKELPFTADIRWEDLRRLNKDPNFQKTITRTVSGNNYTLLPNTSGYVFPIPTNEIKLSGIQQNP